MVTFSKSARGDTNGADLLTGCVVKRIGMRRGAGWIGDDVFLYGILGTQHRQLQETDIITNR